MRGSHHGLAATAVHSREAGYIYATGIVICDVATPCTDGADHTFFPKRSFKAALSSIASARSRFSFVFSSSSVFSRLASDTSADDLFVCETVALHSLVLSMGQSLLQNGLFQRGKVSGIAFAKV